MTAKSLDSEVNKQYYQKSASGRYTVAKVGDGEGWRYLAWDGKQLLGIYMDRGAAQARCLEGNHPEVSA